MIRAELHRFARCSASTRSPAGKARISTLTAGDGPADAILIHGLGGNKTSFFETVSALSPDYTVHAIDLPGFGSSSKPTRAPYDAAWFARSVLRFMDALEIERAHLVGNSMGGRVAIEMGLTGPEPRAQPQPAGPLDGVAAATAGWSRS